MEGWSLQYRSLQSNKKWYIFSVERKLTIFIILILAVITALFVGVVSFRPDLHGEILAYYGLEEEVEVVASVIDEDALLKDSKGMIHNMRLEFPLSVDLQKIKFDNNLFDKSLEITASGIGKGYPLEYPLVSDTEGIREVDYKNISRTGVITVSFNRIFEYETLIEEQFLYLDFIAPKEKYKNVVVIDAGHGGSDPGAVFKSDYEKDSNLEIALKLRDVLKDAGIGVYVTREEDIFLRPIARAEFANDISPDLFVSIHLNSTASGRASDVSGSEVMYYSKESTGRAKEIAKKLSAAISEAIEGKDRGILVGDNIYVLREIKSPAVLCEIGFMTNANELKKIKSEEYQEKIARNIAEIVLEEIE